MNIIKNNIVTMLLLSMFLFFISCDTPEDTKVKDLCKNKVCENSTCSVQNNEAICFCDTGFIISGDECIEDNGVCQNITCSNNGKCKIVEDNPACDCDTGYHAEELDCIKDITGCEPSCVDNEHCKDTDGTFRCICDENYIHNGVKCEYSCPKEHSHVNETNNGCVADDGYYLDDDGNYYLKEGCHADGVDCGNGVCKEDLEKDFYCECANGFFFDGITCVEIKCFEKISCGEGCCENNQVCINNACQDISEENCNEDSDCTENQFCDFISSKCMDMDNEDSCTYHPEIPNQMTPLIKWEWPNADTPHANSKHIMMAPIVANMTDDNGDGVIDLKDIPDVIFSSATAVNGGGAHLRIIDGKTGLDIAEETDHPVHFGSSMAVGDIDNDGKNEIIAISDANRKKLFAFEYNDDNELVLKWSAVFGVGGSDAGISIADINHDRNPEIIVGNYIFNSDGTERCHASDTSSYGHSSGSRHISIVEDINGDGFMDIITGNQYFSGVDCSSLVKRADRNDGYVAIADLNNDGEPEVVVAAKGVLYIYDKMMNDLITPLTLNGNPGGPPTIANFDDDPDLEIAISGSNKYSVINVDLSLIALPTYLWQIAAQDTSSRQTGSSLFDFEGDGIAEVLYADECYFRIYNGRDGSERFKIKNSSITRFEYPLVVDIDNDGKSEVLVVSNGYSWAESKCHWEVNTPTFGIKAFEDSDNRWVRTRRIWNQHSYHVTNVNEDGSIPVTEEHNWESYNNYRLNSQGKGVFNAPDLEIVSIEKTRTDCPSLSFELKVTVLNKGSLTVASELPLSIYKGNRVAPTEVLGTIKTTKYLKPGESETLTFNFTPTTPDSNYNIFAIADDKGNGTGEYNECNENNNSKMISFKGIYNTYCQTGIGQCIRFAPYVCDSDNNLVCGAVAGIAVEEVCDDGFDNNCNGEIDEGCGCETGVKQDCYNGNAMLLVENSRCSKGTQTCIGGEFWDECKDDVLPIPELCNGIDDDCDGETDEDFQLGADCTVGTGACISSGVYICDEEGNQTCNATAGEPVAEICDNNIDDNCNGEIDERPCSL